MHGLDPFGLSLIALALFAGGVLKGATGAGAPLLAVPLITTLHSVPLAVAIMVMPSLVTNIGQAWSFRAQRLSGGFDLRFAGAGVFGALLGTALLASLNERVLTLMVAFAVLGYVGVRIFSPDFRLTRRAADRGVLPIGLSAGLLQGAAGISAPISLSFLNAMRLERATFAATISIFFALTSAAQLPALFVANIMSPAVLALSFASLVPLVLGMPVGSWLARFLSPEGFDRLVLAMLIVLALRMFYGALT